MISKEELLVKISIMRDVNERAADDFKAALDEMSAEKDLKEDEKRVVLGIIKKVCQDREASRALINEIEEKVKEASDRVF